MIESVTELGCDNYGKLRRLLAVDKPREKPIQGVL
jgi:hypothetical protein